VISDLKAHAGERCGATSLEFLRAPARRCANRFSLALLTAAALFVRGAGKAASVDSG